MHEMYLCPLCKTRSNVVRDKKPLPNKFCSICEDRLELGFIHLCASCGHLYYDNGKPYRRDNLPELYGIWEELKEVLGDVMKFEHGERCFFCEMEQAEEKP